MGEVEVLLHSLLTSELEGDELSTPHTGRFIPGKDPRYALNGTLSGLQNLSGRYGKEKHFSCLPGTEPRTFQFVARRYTE